MLLTSEIRPITAGISAPPMIDITRSDEPRFVRAPRFFRLSAKIVGNIMELKKPARTIARTEARPEAPIPMTTQTSAPKPKTESSLGAGMRFIIHDPENLPIINPV